MKQSTDTYTDHRQSEQIQNTDSRHILHSDSNQSAQILHPEPKQKY